MHVKKPYIVPQIIFPGFFLDMEDNEKATEVINLLSLMERGFQNASYSLSRYLLTQESLKKESDDYQEKKRDLREASWSYNYKISDEYRRKYNVYVESDLPWSLIKEIHLKQAEFAYENGEAPYSYVYNTVFYYANNFALAIDQIVLALKKLKEYPLKFIDESLYDKQINELNSLTGSKDIRDAIIHQEDRIRHQAKGKKIIGEKESFGLIEGEPAGVFFNSGLIGNNLTYTNHNGKHTQMEISIHFFQKVEFWAQSIVENIIFRYPHPRVMQI